MPTAMEMDELGRIYSGSAVVDEDNTSGFFTDNQPGESKLVAIFTHSGGNTADYGGQKQSIAYSKDHGLTWTCLLYTSTVLAGHVSCTIHPTSALLLPEW